MAAGSLEVLSTERQLALLQRFLQHQTSRRIQYGCHEEQTSTKVTGLLSYFFVKKIPLSRRVEYVMDGSMDESVSESDDDDDLYFALFTLNLHYICRSKL